MNCLKEKFKKSYNNRKLEEMKHFYDINKGLKESYLNFNKTLDNIKDWDELLNLNEDSLEQIETNELKQNYKKCINFFDIFGVIFCILQLIIVQSSIIIINSIFNEIVEEFKLMINNTSREHNFYENLKINSYREIPEIDVGMITSSIGIFFLKNNGYICSNITFQFSSLILIFLLFVYFNFHIEDELLINYSGWKLFMLILSYIFLSILVGCSSIIALKEYYDIYSTLFVKKKSKESTEKMFFYVFSGISAFLIIIINRKIFKSYKNNITSKNILIIILVISVGCFFLSIIFYFIYLIPIRKKENEENIKNNKRKKNDKKENINTINIYNNNNIINNNEEINSNVNTEEIIIKFNQSFPKHKNQINEMNFEEINLKKNSKKKKEIYSTKICTLCGYIYFQKEINNKKTFIFYFYTNKSTWFKEKIFNFDVMFPFFTELYCQISVVGYNSILTEKLLNEYSYLKNIKFYITLFIFSLVFGVVNASSEYKSIKQKEEKEKKSNNNNKICNYLSFISLFLFGFTLFTFISSIYYYKEKNLQRKRWDNIIMAECIYFKVLDLMILSFYDFFDNIDIFNTSLAITVERYIWMLFEVLFDTYVSNKKNLILIQIIITSLFVPITLILYCYESANRKKTDEENK